MFADFRLTSMNYDLLNNLSGFFLGVECTRSSSSSILDTFRHCLGNDRIFSSFESLTMRTSTLAAVYFSLLVLLILALFATLSTSFALSKDHNSFKFNRSSISARFWRKLRGLKRHQNDKNRKVNDNKSSEYDEDDNSIGASNHSGSSLDHFRHAPKFVRENLAQIINAGTSSFFQKTKWSWEDLTFSAPFNLLLPNDDGDTDFLTELENDEEFYYDQGISNSSSNLSSSVTNRRLELPKNSVTMTHFCFLVHGHRGLSRDLSYMESVMRKQAKIQQRKRIHIFNKQQEVSASGRKSGSKIQSPSRITVNDTAEEREYEGASIQSPIPTKFSGVTDEDSDRIRETSSRDGMSRCIDNENDTSKWEDIDDQSGTTFILPELIVHSVTCNEKKTDDGVVPGGERLVEEILAFIREHMLNMNNNTAIGKPTDDAQLIDITVSFVGNSFGGLYSRYAVAKLADRLGSNPSRFESKDGAENFEMILDDMYRLHFNIFCTTATPHLGLSGHTFIPLSRTAELGVARALGESGRDLFRLNSLLCEMATEKRYIEPLGRFRKRVAYANAYGTDFPVPVGTAAFLSESSTYPHHFMDPDSDKENEDSEESDLGKATDESLLSSATAKDDNNLFVATLHTRKEFTTSIASKGTHDDMAVTGSFTDFDVTDKYVDNLGVDERELARMSASLDSLGWKKVFVDVRKQVPRISISKSLISSLSSTASVTNGSAIMSEEGQGDANDSSSPTNKAFAETSPHASHSDLTSNQLLKDSETSTKVDIRLLKEKAVVQSKDVVAAVTTTPLLSTDSNKISLHWPVGHNMIVAFSRSRWSAYMNKAGRPVVNSLARDLVDDIFAFCPGSEKQYS